MSIIEMAKDVSGTITVNGKQFTNNTGMNMSHAVFLAHQSSLYSGSGTREGHVSTTSIIGPIKKIIYAITNPIKEIVDVSTLVASSKGTAIHQGYTDALEAYNKEHNTNYDCETRIKREVNGYSISGEYDMLTPEGIIQDVKTTGSFTISLLDKELEEMDTGLTTEEMIQRYPKFSMYQLQLSIYSFLINRPDFVQPYGDILFNLNEVRFTDKPQLHTTTFPLLPHEAVEEFLFNRIQSIKDHLANGTVPDCTDVDRGLTLGSHKVTRFSPKTGKYFTAKGSKFDTLAELQNWMSTHGKVGDKVVSVPNEYRMCGWCKFSNICQQFIESEA